MLAVASQIVVDSPDHPRRRSTDHGVWLPPELFRFPEGDEPNLMLLLGQVIEKMSAYADDAAEARKQLGEIREILQDHTSTLKDQTKTLDDAAVQLKRLRTAITVSGIFETAKSWAPVLAILTVIVTAGAWVWQHVKWSA